MNTLLGCWMMVTAIQFATSLLLSIMVLWDIGDTSKVSRPKDHEAFGRFVLLALLSPLWPAELIFVTGFIFWAVFAKVFPRIFRGFLRVGRYLLGVKRQRIGRERYFK